MTGDDIQLLRSYKRPELGSRVPVRQLQGQIGLAVAVPGN